MPKDYRTLSCAFWLSERREQKRHRKLIRNGILLIGRNGTTYTVQGAVLR
ncbi:MAG: hypothetical protein J6Y00_00060 [Paludibacteraceae bacterium]|nr:hypothetical protein [Paludibacteraceae bacterium]